MNRLEHALKEVVKGEVRFDSFSRVLYSTDASIYQIMPVGVVIPRDEDDIVATLRIAAEERVPVLPRGGGTSLAGQSIGAAIILDCAKYMDRILEMNPTGPWARVQPGVVQDELNIEARQYDLRLGPDTATSNRATLGGMVGNNSAGARSIVYGKMIDHTVEIRTFCMDGTELRLQPLNGEDAGKKLASTSREGEIYRAVSSAVNANRDEIGRRFPKILRRVSGYNLDALLNDPTDLRKLIVGSEGTLGIVTEMKVRLVPRPPHSALSVIHFVDLFEAFEATQLILQFHPSAVELIDRMVLEMTRAQLEHARRMTFVQGDPDALLLVEVSGDDRDELYGRLAAMESMLRTAGKGYAFVQAQSPADQENIWRVRRAGQGLLQGIKGDSKPITFVEDTAVAPDRLAPYMRKFKALLDHHGVRAAFYAHASVGCIHVRPLINLKDRHDIEKMKAIAFAVGDLVIEFGGTMSGEHGDGLVRSWFVERFFGPQVYRAFTDVKRAFDPFGLMNPGKIVNGPPIDSSLRYGPAYQTVPVATHFDWSKDGGFARSVELCSGLGACRKKTEGTMCPSYMVTREEEHSTRGRANLLRGVLSGHLPPEELTGRRLYEALDLCLECKGCKAECPANVDMAKLKYEFLAQYHKVHGIPLGTRLFGNFRSLARWGSATAPLSNWAARSAPMRWGLERVAGIDARRRLPPFAKPNFLQWWRRRGNGATGQRGNAYRGTVALFPDTFMIYNYPEIGKAAVGLLERLGYDVILAEAGCCGRTMISKGMIGVAKDAARRNVNALLSLAERGIPIVGCEPSCILTFRDETPDLVPGENAKAIAKHSFLIDEFLAREHERSPLSLRRASSIPDPGSRSPDSASSHAVLFHGHCHQKAIAGTAAARTVLSAAGFKVEEVDSGCCGMAGSFGFEKEHYDVSIAVGERRLLPAIRSKPSVPIVAMGVSCRQQIAHGTGRRALHLVELLASAMDVNEGTGEEGKVI